MELKESIKLLNDLINHNIRTEEEKEKLHNALSCLEDKAIRGKSC